MIYPDIAVPLKTQIQVEMLDRDEQLALQMRSFVSDMTVRGLTGSSAAILQLVEICVSDLLLRIKISYRYLLRATSASPGKVDNLRNDAREYLSAISEEQIVHVMDMLSKQPPFRGGMPFDHGTIRRRLDEKAQREMVRLDLELDLLMKERSLIRNQNAGGNSVHISGSHNIVQAGIIGSPSAIIIDQQSKIAVKEALASVRRALPSANELTESERNEIAEVVSECEKEIALASPNKMKLAGLLSTLSSAVQTVGSLAPAWDTLKTALQSLGIIP